MVRDKVAFQFPQKDRYRGIVTRLRYRVTIIPESKAPFIFIESNKSKIYNDQRQLSLVVNNSLMKVIINRSIYVENGNVNEKSTVITMSCIIARLY